MSSMDHAPRRLVVKNKLRFGAFLAVVLALCVLGGYLLARTPEVRESRSAQQQMFTPKYIGNFA